MPDRDGRVYYTFSKPSLSTMPEATDRRSMQENSLLPKETFARAAMEVIASSETLGQKLGMTLIDLPNAGNFRQSVGEEQWKTFNAQMGAMLRSFAADKKTAGIFDHNRFGVVHEDHISPDDIRRDIAACAADASDGKVSLDIETQNLDLMDDSLSPREIASALVHTIHQFEKQGKGLTIHTLSEGFSSFFEENSQKISGFKRIINQRRFNLKYQPIIRLDSGEPSYFEALVRFDEGRSPGEAISFCEDVGLSPELDLAIVGKVLEFLLNHPDKTLRVSVNLSGVSVQSDSFIRRLSNKLEPHLGTTIPRQMIFEITESSENTDLEKVDHFVKTLQDQGFMVALDDFGAGAASFQYLHKLKVNHVKIDGQYIDGITTNQRNTLMIKHLVQLCRELGIELVAERVETPSQRKALMDLGVPYGQGYLFARPGDTPVYAPPRGPIAPSTSRH